MKYAYYPGCSAHSTARDLHSSSLAVAKALGIELAEMAGWTCCGATAAHETDGLLAASLPAANLAMAKAIGMDMVVNCAECYSRMKAANFEIAASPELRERVKDAIGRDYDGSVQVKHFVEVVLQDIGAAKLRKMFKRSLNGLKVACYYGCLLVRPPEVTHFDDPENPSSLDKLVTAMGGEALDWPHKVECCGGGLNLTRTDVLAKIGASLIQAAADSGADCIAVACPMCQSSLDLRQKDIEKAAGKQFNMPVVYITHLLGLCLGVPAKELGMERLMVSPSAIIKAAGAAV